MRRVKDRVVVEKTAVDYMEDGNYTLVLQAEFRGTVAGDGWDKMRHCPSDSGR